EKTRPVMPPSNLNLHLKGFCHNIFMGSTRPLNLSMSSIFSPFSSSAITMETILYCSSFNRILCVCLTPSFLSPHHHLLLLQTLFCIFHQTTFGIIFQIRSVAWRYDLD